MWSDTRGWDIEWEIQTQEICLNSLNTQPKFSTILPIRLILSSTMNVLEQCISPNLQSSFYHIINGTPSSKDHRHNVSTQVSGFCKYPVLVSAAVSVVRHSLSLSLSQQLALYSHIWYQASLLASKFTHRILSLRLLIEFFIMEHSLKSFLFS